MSKTKTIRNLAPTSEANLLYERAEKAWDKGQNRRAFQLMLAAAEAGVTAAFSTVACFYDFGEGVQPDQEQALYWYGRGASWCYLSANNIGCIWRDRGQPERAVRWFKRAVALGDADANLNIAKIYLSKKRSSAAAVRYLKRARRSKRITEYSKEEAGILLKRLAERSGTR